MCSSAVLIVAVAISAPAFSSHPVRPATDFAAPIPTLDRAVFVNRISGASVPATALEKWRMVLDRHESQTRQSTAADVAHGGVTARLQWDRLIAQARRLDPFAQVIEVDRFFNRMRYARDRDTWGREDHWATPLEFIAAGAGDCEDYAIAKFLALRELGFPDANLRLTVALDRLRQGRGHALLVVTVKGVTFVLDNLQSEPQPVTHLNDYLPLYFIN